MSLPSNVQLPASSHVIFLRLVAPTAHSKQVAASIFGLGACKCLSVLLAGSTALSL